MLYTFKSRGTGDLLMLGPSGDEILRIIGKPLTATGIVQPADIPAAVRAIESAIPEPESQPARPDAASDTPEKDEVTLRQRAWPFLEMLQRAYEGGEAVTWGV